MIWTGELNEPFAFQAQVGFYDTTLRDGEQTVGVVLDPEQKLEIARGLSDAGVERIEAGFPRVSEEDYEAVRRIAEAGLPAEIWGFSRAVRGDVEALVELGVRASVIECPISDLKLGALGVSRDEMLGRIREAVSFATGEGIRVAYFGVDGSRADLSFFEAAYKTAVEAGAQEAVVVDTLGIATPEVVAMLVQRTREWLGPDVPIHFHGHNDFGLATANAVAAVRFGARWIHGTVNGMGERAGNANIGEVALALRALWRVETALDLPRMRALAERVRELSGYELEPWKPLVGENLFRRESGAVASQFHDPPSIEPYSSELVGADRSIVLGKKSGIDSIRIKLEELGLEVPEERRAELLAAVKRLGAEKRGLVTDDEFRRLVGAGETSRFPETPSPGPPARTGGSAAGMTEEHHFVELRRRLGEVDDLRRAAWVLQWDLETMMPPGGAEVRAEQLGTLAGIAHERFTADELGELLEELREYEDGLDYDSDEASLIRVARRDYERARRVPAELRAEMVRAGARGNQAWRRAREANDYALFRPALERNVELQRQYIACLDGGADDPYDVLVAEYEPGLTTPDIAAVFERLRDELTSLVAGLETPAEPPLDLGLSELDRRAAVDKLLAQLGFERDWGRVDRSVHPFMVNFGTGDIRLTVYEEGDLRALYAALHEFGHGLYERGVDPTLERTLLASGASGALHESQSLLWENLVGRSRPFCGWFAGLLGGIEPESLYRAANRIERSLIRVDADPVTYSLHIIFRFELERELVSGALAPADLRDAWNALVEDYLGLAVPDDLQGVLQDIHWSDGLMGYFPSYALGHVASAQIWERARADLPQLDEDLARGEFQPLADWLRERVHRHGYKFTTPETMERAVGSTFDPEPLLRYVRAKIDSS